MNKLLICKNIVNQVKCTGNLILISIEESTVGNLSGFDTTNSFTELFKCDTCGIVVTRSYKWELCDDSSDKYDDVEV